MIMADDSNDTTASGEDKQHNTHALSHQPSSICEATRSEVEATIIDGNDRCTSSPSHAALSFNGVSNIINDREEAPFPLSGLLDPQEVFRASLEFEQLHRPPLPVPIGVDKIPRRHHTASFSSSASLYPSLESVSRAASDDLAIERSWEAASASLKEPSLVSSSGKGASVGDWTGSGSWLKSVAEPRSGTAARSPAGKRRTVTVSALGDALRKDDRSIRNDARMYDSLGSSSSSSSRINNGSLHYDDSSHAAGLYAATVTAASSGSSTVPSTATAYAEVASRTDVHNDGAAMLSNMAEFIVEGGDDDIELKRAKWAAYYGGTASATGGTSLASSPVIGASGNTMPPVATATATIVDYETSVQFWEDESQEAVVEAEYVCQSTDNAVSQQEQGQRRPYLDRNPLVFPASNTAPLFSEPATYMSPSFIRSNSISAIEATVLESGPAEKATQAAWFVDAAEALVLDGGEYSYVNSSDVDLDTKPPAVYPSNEEHAQAPTATFVSPSQQERYHRHIPVVASYANVQDNGMSLDGTVATVVEYDVHPSEMMGESAQASFVGNSALNIVDESMGPSISALDAAVATTLVDYDLHPSLDTNVSILAEFVGDVAQNAIADQNVLSTNPQHAFPGHRTTTSIATADSTGQEVEVEQATEATVVDSGPMEKATAEAWSTGAAEEAQVLGSDYDGTVAAVPAGIANTKPYVGRTISSSDDTFNREAEVVGISEDIHPIEFASEGAATAEFIGSDSNCAIAVPSEVLRNHSGNRINESCADAFIVGNSIGVRDADSSFAPQEDTTLVAVAEYDVAVRGSQTSSLNHQPSSLSTIPEATADSECADQEILAAAVFEVEGVENDDAGHEFYDYPQKPVAVGTRSMSEPVTPTTTGNLLYNNHDDIRTVSRDGFSGLGAAGESDWMLTPSFAVGDGPRPLSPPVVTATLVDNENIGSNEPIPPPIPTPRSLETTTSTTSRNSGGSTRSVDATASRRECSAGAVSSLSTNIVRGTNNVMEMLFGQGYKRKPTSFELGGSGTNILPRTLLPASVIYSEATQSWVATINTNQKALDANNVEESSKALRAFSVPSKKQAVCLAGAWAPPRMHAFSSNPICFICEAHFAVLRRACHCRNCGVCICSSCAVQWPQKMLPATYNIKGEGIVNVCKACDWLCSSFRSALLQGDADKAIALHATGNINLTTPFANVKGELFYPVHCAVIGGSLSLLKWLVDEHCCPLRSIRVSSGRQKDTSGSYTPILTSKGRSLLTIALGNRNIGIVRYLVVEKRMLLWAEKDLSIETLVQNLDLVLRILPEDALGEQAYDEVRERDPTLGLLNSPSNNSLATSGVYDGINSAHLTATTEEDLSAIRASLEMNGDLGPSHDECIICFSNLIDCVNTKCGHQICCLECSRNITRCPVCSGECNFIRVYRA